MSPSQDGPARLRALRHSPPDVDLHGALGVGRARVARRAPALVASGRAGRRAHSFPLEGGEAGHDYVGVPTQTASRPSTRPATTGMPPSSATRSIWAGPSPSHGAPVVSRRCQLAPPSVVRHRPDAAAGLIDAGPAHPKPDAVPPEVATQTEPLRATSTAG